MDLTKQEIAWLRSLDASQTVPWFLDLFSQNPAAAIDARLAAEVEFPDSLYTGATKEQTAAFFGVKIETIDGWVRNGMPILRRGRRLGGVGRHQRSGFDLRECAEWLADQRKVVAEAQNEEATEADTRYRQEKARMQELRRQQLEGSLVDVALFERKMAIWLEAIRKGIESLNRSYDAETMESFARIVDEAEKQALGDDFNESDNDRKAS